MDMTLPCDWMALEEDQPLLRLIPAVFEAARRSCVTVLNYFAAKRLARFEKDEFSGEPSAQFGSDTSSPFQDREEWFD